MQVLAIFHISYIRILKMNVKYSVHAFTGSKLKKSSGRLFATNWRNVVASCKFLVAILYDVNDTAHSQGFWYFERMRSPEIHKNTQNTAKFGRNLTKYMSEQHIWNLSLQTTSRNYQVRLCCEKLGSSHNVKGFAIGLFMERIVSERANDDFC